MSKICIWCNKSDKETCFDKEAHTIPQSLGGKNICIEVCDICNEYFGNRNDYNFPIEIALKETFNPTRFLINYSSGEFGKGKTLPRFKSEIFDLNIAKREIIYKKRFRLDINFQNNFVRLFKRGIYKVFIEEIQRQLCRGFDINFRDIKDFARYDIGDFPVFYWRFKRGAIFVTPKEITDPKFYFVETQLKMIDEIGFYEFRLFGHFFGIPLTKNYNTNFDQYFNRAMIYKNGFFTNLVMIKEINDIDIFLNRVNN